MQPETDILEPAVLSVAWRLLSNGPADIDWLTRRLRTQLKDARLTVRQVTATVASTTALVGRPDGRVCRLLDVLEGQTLTHRVTAATTGRTDLWTNLSLQPLHVCAMFDPIPLASGGELRAAEFGHDALVGPPGWLPDVPSGGLVAVSIEAGRVRLEPLPQGVTASPEHEQGVRATLARHIREEAWWSDFGEPNREAELDRAIGNALLEDPCLFTTPVSPLTELLHDVLTEHSRRHLFDDRGLGRGRGRLDAHRGDSGGPLRRTESTRQQVRHVLRQVRRGDPRSRRVAHAVRGGPRSMGGLGVARRCTTHADTPGAAKE